MRTGLRPRFFMIQTDNFDWSIEADQEIRPVKWLTASRWKMCDRAMWLNLRNVAMVSHKATTLRTFAIGHKLEDLIVEWIQGTGIKVMQQQAELLNKWKRPIGHIDGIGYDGEQFFLIEIKTANAKRFKEMVKDGPPSYYEAQMQIYMHHSPQLSSRGARLEKCMFVVLNKDTSEIHCEWIDYEPIFAAAETERMENIIESEAMPEATADYTCNWCDFRTVCKGEALASVNCRTCANVSVVDGDFSCRFGDSTCGNHVMHPQLMGLRGHVMEAADPEQMAIDYGRFVMAPAGVKIPGRPTFTSTEFAQAETMLDDEKYMEICAKFGASPC